MGVQGCAEAHACVSRAPSGLNRVASDAWDHAAATATDKTPVAGNCTAREHTHLVVQPPRRV